MVYSYNLNIFSISSKENKEKILKLKENLNPNIDIVTFKYNTHFDKDNNPILTSTRGRLFKREKNYLWNDPIHEYIELRGNIYYANDIFVSHKKESTYTDRNLKIYQKSNKKW